MCLKHTTKPLLRRNAIHFSFKHVYFFLRSLLFIICEYKNVDVVSVRETGTCSTRTHVSLLRYEYRSFCVTVYNWKYCDRDHFPCQWNESKRVQKNTWSLNIHWNAAMLFGVYLGHFAHWNASAWIGGEFFFLRVAWAKDLFCEKRFPISFLVALSNPQLLANR